jgi:hypothetical protein
MDPARLVEGYISIMRTIYNPREYYQRVLDSLKRTPKAVAEPVSYTLLGGLTAFTRLTVKLGVVDRERREFWRFFVEAAAHHRHKFIEAMRLAALGYHFRKLNEAYGES